MRFYIVYVEMDQRGLNLIDRRGGGGASPYVVGRDHTSRERNSGENYRNATIWHILTHTPPQAGA